MVGDLLARHVKLAHAIHAARSQSKDGENSSGSNSQPPSAGIPNTTTSTFQPTQSGTISNAGSAATAASVGSGSAAVHFPDTGGADNDVFYGSIESHCDIPTVNSNPRILRGTRAISLGTPPNFTSRS